MTTKRLLVLALATAAFRGGLAAQAATTLEAQLARAALLETQGNLAEAEQELLAAAKLADAARAGEVDAALRALRQRTGRASPGAQDPTAKPATATGGGGDPIQALLATLEVGSNARPEVEAAINELIALDALAVPPLLAALPKLGPFGARNVAKLLYLQDDPRILPALRQRIAAGDAAFATMLANDLHVMPRSWPAALARDLASRELPGKARLAVLKILVEAGAEEREWQPLVDSLAPATDLHTEILAWYCDQPGPARPKLLTLLNASPDENVRAAAVQNTLLTDLRCEEEQALQALDPLSPASAPWVASKLVEQHPSWVRVGIRALARTGWLIDEPWFRRVEWWRLPDEAAPALLSLTQRENHSTDTLFQILDSMAEQGWRAPADLDEKLRQIAIRSSGTLGMSVLVKLLPVADEDRAFAMWQGLPPMFRRGFVDTLTPANRPWHRIVVAQIAATTSAREFNVGWLARDWSGLTEDGGRTLVKDVTRLIETSPVAPAWIGDLTTACDRHRGLPADLLVPAMRVGGFPAFRSMVSRDASAAFALVAQESLHSKLNQSVVMEELALHGDKRQLPLAIRLFRENPSLAMLDGFFARHGAGELSVIELGKAPWPHRGPAIAAEAIKSVRAENMVTVLTMLPDLAQQVAQNFMSSAPAGTIPRFSDEQRKELRAAIERLLPRLEDPGANGHFTPMEAMCIYVNAVGKWGDPSDMPLLRRISAASQDHALRSSVAVAMLGLAGPNRNAVLTEMFDSKNVSFVSEALRAEDLRTNADLRQHALQAVLLLGPELHESPFDNLHPADALAMAKTIVDHPEFARFHGTLARRAVNALGATKDEAMVPIILRGASHPYPDVGRAAVEALGDMFTESAARALLELLRDEDETTRNLAKTRLDQIGEYLDARAKWDARKK